MKSKKLISLLCAAALTASSFASMAVTASAASDPVWSFDGSDATGWSGSVTPTVKTDEGSTDQYLDFQAGERTQANKDITFTLPTQAQLTNDYVLEYDTNIHTSNGMGRLNQYTQLAFTGENPTAVTQDFGGDYATAVNNSGINPDTGHSFWTDTNIGYGVAGDIVSSLTARVELQGNMVVNYADEAPTMQDGEPIGDSKWVRVRAAVKDGKATVTIADSNNTIVDAQEYTVSASKLNKIVMSMGRADTQYFIPTTPANIKLDNIKVYNGIENAPAFSTAGLRKSAVVATPVPAPEKVAGVAPYYSAPESVNTPYTADFNGAQTGVIEYVQTAETEAKTVVDGMKVKLGNRDTGADQKTYASIVQIASGDKALRLSADQFSTNGRGPVVSLDDNIDITDTSSGSAVMGFAVYLSRTSTTGAERLFLLDNTTNVDGNGCARDVLAVITTEDIQNEDETYKYTAGESNIGVHVEPEAWHYITVVVSGDAYRVFVDGAYKDDQGKLAPALKNDLVGTGEGNKSAVTHLPLLAVENTKSDAGTVYSTALIDNVVAYYIQGDIEPNILPATAEAPTPAPPTPTPVPKHSVEITQDQADPQKVTVKSTDTADDTFDGVLIHVAYNTDKTLKSVKSYDAKSISKTGALVTIPATDVVYAGDKLMVWNSLKDMVPYGSADAKGVQIFAVTGTIGEGVAKVVFTDSTDNTKVFETTTGTVNVPAGTYALTVAAKSGYENAVVTPTSLTVSADVASGAFNATATKVIPKYAVKGTVDAGVATVTLTNKTDNSKTYTGSIDGTAVSFANVEEGTYTISATFVAGKEVNAITPAEITVDAQTGTDSVFAITSKDSALPAITGTVAIDGTAKVGQTLTATVTGLNDGKAAKYQWQANTGAEGAYVAIENATNATFEIPESLLGKTIKVVVTADGTSGSIESAATAAVAAKTYTVSGTVDAGVDTVKLHPATDEDHSGDIAGTIDGTTVTFSNVVAGTYDIEATAKTGYKDVVIKVGETATTTVEVTNANVENLAITTTKKIAVTGTVAGTGVTAVKLTEKLEAGSEATPAEYTGTIKDGTVTFDDIKAATYTVSATGTDSNVNIVINNTEIIVPAEGLADAFTVTGTDTALYRENVTALASAQISYSLVEADIANTAAVTAEEVAKSNVADFDTATEKTAAIPTLDGWGYRHFANASMDKNGTFQPGRQTKAGVDAATNAVYASGVGNGGCNGAVSFILGNVSNVKVPSTGKIVYTFDAIVKTTAGTAVKNHTFGLTSAADGSSVSSVASTTIANSTTETVTKKIVMTYSVDNKTYTISVDGVQVANGKTDTPVTGIYAQAGEAYADVSIANLVVTTTESDPAITVNTVNAAEGESATADKYEVNAGDTVTITVKKNAGRKISVTAKDNKEASIAVAESDGKYTFTMPEEGNATVTVTYARADVTSVTVNGDTTQIQKGQSASGYTATLKAGETEVAGDVVWTVVGKTSADTKFENGALTIGADETAETVTLTATTRKDITVDSDDDNTISGTKTITVVSEPVYNITKGTETNGTFKINVGSTENATTAKTGDTITIVPTPAVGYVVSEVSYTPNGGDKQVVANNEGYKVTGITADITVNVTFTAIPYTITNSNATADENNNSIKIKVGVAEASAEASVIANYQNTITVEPIMAEGYKLSTLTYQVGTDEPVDILSSKSFSMPASDVTVTATFIVKPVLAEALTIYSNNFDETSDFTAGGKTDGTTHNPGAVTSRDEGKVIAVGSASGDANLTSPSFSTLENYTTAVNTYDATKFNVSFDFKLEGVYSGKGSSIALLGGTSASSWLNSNKQILTINMKCGSGAGYFSELTVNGVDVLSTLKESTATYDIGTLNRDSTGWVTLNSTIDFATKNVTFSLSKNNAVVVAEQTVDFVNTDTTVLDRLFMAAGKSYGGVYVDNLVVEAAPTAPAVGDVDEGEL